MFSFFIYSSVVCPAASERRYQLLSQLTSGTLILCQSGGMEKGNREAAEEINEISVQETNR